MFQWDSVAKYLSVIILLGLPLAGAAQQMKDLQHTVRASASATAKAKPDRAEVSVSVLTQAATSEQASQQNAAISARVLSELKRVIDSSGEVKTTGFVASPQLQYPKNGGTPKITGYQTLNRVTATVDEISLASKLIDAAINAGATAVDGVTFSVKDNQAIRERALAEASRKAYASAEAIAKALHLTVVGVLDAETGATEVPPRPMMRMAVAQSVEVSSTVIEPSDVEVTAAVTVTLEVR